MTSGWFADLAERLAQAASFAALDDERSCAADFTRARGSAEEYVYRMAAAEAAVTAAPNPAAA